MSVYVIAEAGSTPMWDERGDACARATHVAAAAGANAIKYQFWSSPQRMRDRRSVRDVDAYERGSLPAEWLPLCHALAQMGGLDFMCTAYLPEDIPTVAPYVSEFKVSSFEAQDKEFVSAHKKYGKRIIISSGMLDGEEESTICGFWDDDTDILHCVSSYPTPIDQANVAGVFGADGYSDHTKNVLTGALAVAAGAMMLEVHFRLDSTLKTCPDYPVSLSPDELGQYIANVRLAERLMGNGTKQPQACERENMKYRVIG